MPKTMLFAKILKAWVGKEERTSAKTEVAKQRAWSGSTGDEIWVESRVPVSTSGGVER